MAQVTYSLFSREAKETKVTQVFLETMGLEEKTVFLVLLVLTVYQDYQESKVLAVTLDQLSCLEKWVLMAMKVKL
jgi:hypothetical protein